MTIFIRHKKTGNGLGRTIAILSKPQKTLREIEEIINFQNQGNDRRDAYWFIYDFACFAHNERHPKHSVKRFLGKILGPEASLGEIGKSVEAAYCRNIKHVA